MNNWCICWFFTHIFTGILIFKALTARRLYKSFGVKGLKSAKRNRNYRPRGTEIACINSYTSFSRAWLFTAPIFMKLTIAQLLSYLVFWMSYQSDERLVVYFKSQMRKRADFVVSTQRLLPFSAYRTSKIITFYPGPLVMWRPTELFTQLNELVCNRILRLLHNTAAASVV
jgi:hypothetical protein